MKLMSLIVESVMMKPMPANIGIKRVRTQKSSNIGIFLLLTFSFGFPDMSTAPAFAEGRSENSDNEGIRNALIQAKYHNHSYHK